MQTEHIACFYSAIGTESPNHLIERASLATELSYSAAARRCLLEIRSHGSRASETKVPISLLRTPHSASLACWGCS
jgi:hypothetical protein